MSQRNGMGMFEHDVRVIGVIPKSAQYEMHITFKSLSSSPTQVPQPFVDLREYWFKDGPMEEPIPTGKGVMIKEERLSKVIEFLLLGMKSGSIDGETADMLVRLIESKKAE